MDNTQRKICEDAIQIFGVPAQLDMAVEEMSELTKEICKHKRGLGDKGHIAEEIADVEIMLEQLKLIFDRRVSVEAQVDSKLDRLQGRIKEAINASNR